MQPTQALQPIQTDTCGRIVIVDDDPAVCDTLQAILECEGHDCRTAANSTEALTIIEGQGADLVIADLQLENSRHTGIELIELVRKYDDTIPSILITGYPSIGRVVDAMKRGAVDFLSKPFDRDLLLHQVAKALQERRLRQENQRLQAEVNKTAVIEMLNRELDGRIGELTRLYTISEAFNEFMDTETLFRRIAGLASQITGAQRVSVMVLDRTRSFMRIRTAIGLPDDVVRRTRVAVGEGIAGSVAVSGLPARMTRENREQQLVEPRDPNGDPSYETQSWLSMPLLIGREIFGVINLTDKVNGFDFTRDDEQIMSTLIEKAGIKLENQALYEGIYSNLIDTLTSLVTTIEAKDPYTREHSQRVTEYSIDLAQYLGLDEEHIEMLGFAGVLHDIGKIGVRDEILTKAVRLTADEYNMIKMHPIIGERIVKPLGLVKEEKSIIRHHHERWDGNGYPDGLAGEQIPLLARVVSVADAFDAMTSTRSYRRALPIEVATEEMMRFSGSQFDPTMVEAFLAAVAEGIVSVPHAEARHA